jgi:hypothetical protein
LYICTMKKVLTIGGLLFIGFSLCYLAMVLDNKSNDDYWYTRTYTVIKMHQSEHMYKGKSQPDYFLTKHYEDDLNHYWTAEVSGSMYFSSHVGGVYIERDIKPDGPYNFILGVLIVICVIGIIMLAIGIVEELD